LASFLDGAEVAPVELVWIVGGGREVEEVGSVEAVSEVGKVGEVDAKAQGSE